MSLSSGISNLIRAKTLAVSLTANIIAGHLLLTLLGNNGPSIRHTLLTALITAQILLLILEAAVAIIYRCQKAGMHAAEICTVLAKSLILPHSLLAMPAHHITSTAYLT
jgi:putative effector of murein hydrolase LrgA (UPF0299 family)